MVDPANCGACGTNCPAGALCSAGARAYDPITYVKASNTGASHNFGASIAISADGNTVAIGAYAESSNATGINGNQADDTANAAGAVYIY